MVPVDNIGFPVFSWHCFRVHRRWYRVGTEGVKAVTLAAEILRLVESRQSLLPLRARIRAMRMKDCKAALAHLVQATPDRRLRLIAIWLRGQCGGYIGAEIIANFARDDDERTRVAVVKALQRMRDWNVLELVSVNDASERVHRLALPRVPRNFTTRLHKYAENVSPIAVCPRPRFLYLSPLLDLHKPLRTRSLPDQTSP